MAIKWDVVNYHERGSMTKATLSFEATVTRNGKEVLFVAREGDTGRLRYTPTDKGTDKTAGVFVKYARRVVNELGPEWVAQTDAAWIVWRGAHRRTRIPTFLKKWAEGEAIEKQTRPCSDAWAVVIVTQKGQMIRATHEECFPSEKVAAHVAEQLRVNHEQAGWSRRFKEIIVVKGSWKVKAPKIVKRLKIGRVEKCAQSNTMITTTTHEVVRLIEEDIIDGICKTASINADPLHVAIYRWYPRIVTKKRSVSLKIDLNKWSAAVAEQFSFELRRSIVVNKLPAAVIKEYKRIANLISSAISLLGRDVKRITKDVYSKRSVALGRDALRWLDAVRAEEIAETLGTRDATGRVDFKWTDAKLEAFKEQLAKEEIERRQRKGKKRRSKKRRVRTARSPLTPEQMKGKVGELLKALESATDKGEKRKLRAQLRRLGHQGGLRAAAHN